MSLNARMFMRLLLRATTVRRGRTLTALLALTVAAAVATAMLNLYEDLQTKLAHEFRRFGANLVVAGENGAPLPDNTLEQMRRMLRPGDVAVPFAYAVAKTPQEKPIVVVGTDFNLVKRLNTWWSVSAWPEAPHAALIGERAAAMLHPEDGPVKLAFHGRAVAFTGSGTVRTGGAEDSRVYIDLKDFTEWTGVAPSVVEIAATGSSEEVAAAMQRLVAAFPKAEVRPVRQIVAAETHVLGKTRSLVLASTLLIALMVTLCVLATLTASVFERRRDYAVMKALGSSQRRVNALFLSESLVLGIAGGVAGFVVGSGLAAWIGRANFHAAVLPRADVLPIVLAGSLLVALLSATLPLTILQKLEPAVMLKGE